HRAAILAELRLPALRRRLRLHRLPGARPGRRAGLTSAPAASSTTGRAPSAGSAPWAHPAPEHVAARGGGAAAVEQPLPVSPLLLHLPLLAPLPQALEHAPQPGPA